MIPREIAPPGTALLGACRACDAQAMALSSRQKPRFLPAETQLMSEKAP
jgi:hypothetical protein